MNTNQRASQIIATLQSAIAKHGDLPCFTENGAILRLEIAPTIDGVERLDEDAPAPGEFTLIFHEG